MKKLGVLIVLFLTMAFYGFSEVLLKRTDGDNSIKLEKLDTENISVLWLSTLEPDSVPDVGIVCYVYCYDMNKLNEIKRLVADMTKTKKYYDFLKDKNIKEIKESTEFQNDVIFYMHYFLYE